MADPKELAEAFREACVHAVLQAYENAGTRGLCGDRRWEVAVGALGTFDLGPLVDVFQRGEEWWQNWSCLHRGFSRSRRFRGNRRSTIRRER